MCARARVCTCVCLCVRANVCLHTCTRARACVYVSWVWFTLDNFCFSYASLFEDFCFCCASLFENFSEKEKIIQCIQHFPLCRKTVIKDRIFKLESYRPTVEHLTKNYLYVRYSVSLFQFALMKVRRSTDITFNQLGWPLYKRLYMKKNLVWRHFRKWCKQLATIWLDTSFRS